MDLQFYHNFKNQSHFLTSNQGKISSKSGHNSKNYERTIHPYIYSQAANNFSIIEVDPKRGRQDNQPRRHFHQAQRKRSGVWNME
jgi:hypothetical protein